MIALRMSKFWGFTLTWHILEKTLEIDNEARIINENGQDDKKFQKKSKAHNSVRHLAKLSNILGYINDNVIIIISQHIENSGIFRIVYSGIFR